MTKSIYQLGDNEARETVIALGDRYRVLLDVKTETMRRKASTDAIDLVLVNIIAAYAALSGGKTP
jgi:hypothetical protein